MKLHCLGTAGYHPNEQRHTSCYFIPEAGIVLDAGTGFFRLPSLIETNQLDIFLSHAHADHIFGLTFLFDVLYQRPLQQVRVWGDPEKLQAIQQHLFSELIFPVTIDVQWCPLLPNIEIPLANRGRCKPFALEHPGGVLGFRMDWEGGPSLAYVTDTTGDPTAAYVETIAGVQLLMHECNFRDSGKDWAIKTGHSWTTAVAEVAEASGVQELLLTHISPLELGDDPIDIQVARKIFKNTIIASDGMVIDVGTRG